LPPGAPLQGRYFRVPLVQVNQASQTFAGDIPLVAGRPGVLRVFVQSSEGGAPGPTVEVRLYHEGQLLATERLAPPAGTVPVSVLSDLTTLSWNLPLPPEWVTPGLAVEARV